MEKHSFSFCNGKIVIARMEMTFDEARPYCYELAKEYNTPIRMYAYNTKVRKTEYLGMYRPDGVIIDERGDEYRLETSTLGNCLVRKSTRN